MRAGIGALAVALLISQPTWANDRRPGEHGGEPGSFLVGWTHERWSPDKPFPEHRAREALRLLRTAAPIQNVHIMGWGAPSPMPAPDVLDLSHLDRRIQLVRDTNGIPVITLCCAPDWMKGGQPGHTAWSRLNVAPLRKHFRDFASLAAKIAARYPDVKHFLVWNELKGFWDRERNQWNIELYTEFYNIVHAALRAERPDALIGGPYLPVTSRRLDDGSSSGRSQVQGEWGYVQQRTLDALSYWLKNNEGADFVVVDGSITPKGKPLSVPPSVGLEKFVAIQRWIRQRTELPVWWAELYPSTSDMDESRAVKHTLRALDLLAREGASVVLLWDPNCRESARYGRWVCLWTDIRSDPVKPSALAVALQSRYARRGAINLESR